MPVADRPGSQEFPPHTVSWSDFDELARGYAEPKSVHHLRRAEHSRRKLLLRALDDKLTKVPDMMDPLPPPEEAWQLFDRVEHAAPQVLDLIIAHPYTGAWAGYVTRLVRNQITGVCPLWMHVGHLHALAAAAAIRAGIPFNTKIPVWDGHAVLPTLGMARLSTDASWSVAHIQSDGDHVEISNDMTLIHLPRKHTEDTPDWWGLRRLSTHANGHRLSVWLDDLDPYRGLSEPVAPQRLSSADVTGWGDMLDEAWQLIVRYLPSLAPGFPPGLDSLVPRPAIPFRNLSASTGEAFGSAIVARPPDAPALAATLVHEFHHILLSGLLHLVPMHIPDTRERFYTLWRDDPRPIGGVLQGVFAFFGVTAFWRSVARNGQNPESRRAEFEFAYWRAGAWETLRALSGDDSLTPEGQRFVDGIAERLGAWQDDPVAPDVASLAASAAADHRAGWRMRYVRPEPEMVAEVTKSWLARQPCPTSTEPDPHPVPTPVPDGGWSGARTDLIRESLTITGRQRLRETWPLVHGAMAADFAYVSEHHGDAVRGYRADLAQNPENPHAWIGLGLSLSAHGGDSAGARALLECPHLVRAVYRSIRATTSVAPDPSGLAVWIGRSVC